MTSPDSERAGLATGLVIANRFRLSDKLGEGGMGCVWKAHHLTLGIDVAIKFIDASLAKNDEAISRFAQEAMAAARIKSPHVVSILDYGTDTTGRPYIAMELLDGEDLASRLERDTTLSVAETARMLTQACRGLSKAHAESIVHRDLKPENLFLCTEEDGFLLKILDFGIAKAQMASAVRHKTAMGAVIGTPAYMSPEQASGEGRVDHRSDLYSLATVVYHAMAGEPPFPANNLQVLLVALLARTPPPLSVRQPHLTTKFDAWFAKALAKSPDDRFQSAREMAETFVSLCSSAGSTSEDWTFTGSELHAVKQPPVAIDGPTMNATPSPPAERRREEAVGPPEALPPVDPDVLVEALKSIEGTQKGLGPADPSSVDVPISVDEGSAYDDDDDDDDETEVAPPPALAGMSQEESPGPPSENDDEDETEIGGFFPPAMMGDRIRVIGAGSPKKAPPAASVGADECDDTQGSRSGPPVEAADAPEPEPKRELEPRPPPHTAASQQDELPVALAAVIVVAVACVVALGFWWFYG